ncbi:MAG: hypothetical protein HY329_22930 [Chloroflexi bacterium]|nr:hypothetical protein [Chloroflexota bacterium]
MSRGSDFREPDDVGRGGATGRPVAIVDPRGDAPLERAQLAARPPSLEGRRVLLFDNGKLGAEYGPYEPVFRIFEQHLRDQHGALVARHRHNLLDTFDRAGAARILAAEVRPHRPDAVVIGLCDAGVTLPSTLLAVELERAGIPSVLVCNELGTAFAGTIAAGFAPRLPSVRFDAPRSATAQQIEAEATAVTGALISALTSSPESAPPVGDLADRPDSRLRTVDGRIELTPRRAGTAGDDPLLYAAELYDALGDAHLTDGLPVIPPVPLLVDEMLAATDRSPEYVLMAECTPSGAPITIAKLAVNAVMAGCRPEYFPIVVAAMEAMCEPRYRLPFALVTTHPAGNAVVVSGPLATQLGIQSSYGCLGPGFRANATIGRALTLTAINVARAIPGVSDLSALGSPAELTYCFAEDVSASPWTGLHEDLYGPETTSVTVLKAEAPRGQLDHRAKSAEGFLTGLAAGMTGLLSNNAYHPCEILVILNPQHASLVASEGWSKQDVQRFLFERARNPRELLQGRGTSPSWPAEWHTLDRVPIVHDPSEIVVVVAGGPAPQSMVALPWGLSRAVSRPVRPTRQRVD